MSKCKLGKRIVLLLCGFMLGISCLFGMGIAAYATEMVEVEGISKVYKGMYANTAYTDFVISFSKPIAEDAKNIEYAANIASYSSILENITINGMTLKEIAEFSNSYAGWSPDNMRPIFGMHIENGNLHISLCAINFVNDSAAESYGVNKRYLFKLDGTDVIKFLPELTTKSGATLSAEKTLNYSNKWFEKKSNDTFAPSTEWTISAPVLTEITADVISLSSVAETTSTYKVAAYFKNEIDSLVYIQGFNEYYLGGANANDLKAQQFAKLSSAMDNIYINGVKWKTIALRNSVTQVDCRKNKFIIEIAKTDAAAFKADGTDVIELKKGLTLPNVNKLAADRKFYYYSSIVADANMESVTDAWAADSPVVAGEMTLNGMDFGREVGAVHELTFNLRNAQGGAASIGLGGDKEKIAAFNEHILINGKTVQEINTLAADSVKIHLEGNRIVLTVKSTALKLDDTDVVEIKSTLAFTGITLSGGKTYTYYHTIGGYLVSLAKTENLPTIKVNNIKGMQISANEKRMAIEFSDTASEQFFFHISALYKDFEWLKNSYPQYSEFYASADEIRIQTLIVNNVVSSIYDKISIKEENGEYKTLRELSAGAVVNETMAHYGQDYISGVNLNTLILSVKAINTDKSFSVKVSRGFVTPTLKQVDADYVYHYNPVTKEIYPDESLITRNQASVTSITKAVRGGGYTKFSIKFSKTSAFNEIGDALNNDFVKNYIKINGKTLKEIMDSSKDAQGAAVVNPIKARYGYQSEGSSYVVLYLEIAESIATEGKLNFDGKDVICIMKDFETPNKSYMNKFYGGILNAETLGWQLKNGNSEIIYTDEEDEVVPPIDKGGNDEKGCGCGGNVTMVLFSTILALGAAMFVIKR